MKKIIFTIIFALFLYYFMLPPINLSCPLFYEFIFLVGMCYFLLSIIDVKGFIDRRTFNKSKKYVIAFCSVIGVFAIIILINIICSPLFNSKSYHDRISVVDGNFESDVAEVDYNTLALLDKDSSTKLGDRVMGQMTDLVSQFKVSDLYTQISYDNKIVRVTPLEYASVIKYFTNRDGVKGYITVDSVNGESNLVRLEKGMKYMKSALFFENLDRKLRLSYPTVIFGDSSFELDDSGKPFWVIQTLKYTGVGLKKEVSGVITLDPVTGETNRYNIGEVPEWIDHVYSADLLIEQLNDWGKYKNGFFNSIFGQKEVVMTTTGYNYLIMGEDVYLYTGITSVASDESNVGFVLINLRTKDTKFYNVAGAEEYSAMDSAKGAVQQMNYTSTFPLLINLNGKPTYLLSLKDNAGLVKMYAFVDYENYQKVVVSDASEGIIKAAQNYLGGVIIGEKTTKELEINSIRSAVVDGVTYYYIKTVDDVYKASIKVKENMLPFLTSGDIIKVTLIGNEIVEIES